MPERTEPPNTAAPAGRREKNRLATTLRIEDAATSLFLERGVDAVTIEEICEGAEISRRSFFNYFESKEELISGHPEKGLDERISTAIEELSENPERAFHLRVMELVGREYIASNRAVLENSIDPELSKEIACRRAKLFADSPQLFHSRMRYLDLVREQFKEAIFENLKTNPGNRVLPHLSLEEEALLIVCMVTTTMRSVMTFASQKEKVSVGPKEFELTTAAMEQLHQGFGTLNFQLSEQN